MADLPFDGSPFSVILGASSKFAEAYFQDDRR